jgi:hypothetical protein
MSALANRPLPEGVRVATYRIRRVLASLGFSFVDLAHDGLVQALPALVDLAEERAGPSCDNRSVLVRHWSGPGSGAAGPTDATRPTCSLPA